MRHFTLLIAVIVLCAMGPPSWAYYNPFGSYAGGVKFKLVNYDVGTQYIVDDGEYTEAELHALPTTDPGGGGDWRILPTGAAASEDSWGILRLTNIYSTDELGNETGTLWQDLDGGWQITAIFWGEHDQGLIQDTGVSGVEQLIWGNNMNLAFFANQPTIGTDDWLTVWQLGPGARETPNPEFEGITDSPGADHTLAGGAVPLWTFESVYGFNTNLPSPDAEFVNTFVPANPAPGEISGNGGFYANKSIDPYWGEGAENSRFIDNYFGDHALEIEFTAGGNTSTGAPGHGWLVGSDDPIRGGVTPELSSGTLMLLGLLPMGLVAWRRRKS